ncbi:MAG: hypothetical protein WBA12_11030 [Catalinimonas sp.]
MKQLPGSAVSARRLGFICLILGLLCVGIGSLTQALNGSLTWAGLVVAAVGLGLRLFGPR